MKRMQMKKMLSLSFVVIVIIGSASLGRAGNPPQTGTIISENSVDCGTKRHGKKEQMDLLCQEYVLSAGNTEYHIRQPKQKDQALLPLNSNAEFEMDKDKMKLKVNGKKYEFIVVSESAAKSGTNQ